VLDQCARVVSLAVEIVREENINLIYQQNLRALILAQVNLWHLSLELLLKNMRCENITYLSFSVDLKFSHLIEGSILYQILEIQSCEHCFKTLIVSHTQVLAVACALDFETIEGKYHAYDGECHRFTLSGLDLNKIISDIT